MIPEPIRKKIGDEIVRIMLAVPRISANREDNARRVLKALLPYFKKPAAHRLTKMHVSALLKLRLAHQMLNKRAIHIRKEMYDVRGECPYRLTYDELNNFTKLRYFALAVHADKNRTRSGFWTITTLGGAFLRNESDVSKRVYTFNSHPVAHSDEKVRFADFRHQLPDMETYQDFVPRRSSASQTARLFA